MNNKKHILEKRRRQNAKIDCVDSDEDRHRDIVHEIETYGKINQLNPQNNMYKAFCAKPVVPFDEQVAAIKQRLKTVPIECWKYNHSLKPSLSNVNRVKCLLNLSEDGCSLKLTKVAERKEPEYLLETD